MHRCEWLKCGVLKDLYYLNQGLPKKLNHSYLSGSYFVLANNLPSTDHFNRLTHLTNRKSGGKEASYYYSCSYGCSFFCLFCCSCWSWFSSCSSCEAYVSPFSISFIIFPIYNDLMAEIWPIILCDRTHYDGHFCNPMDLLSKNNFLACIENYDIPTEMFLSFVM